MKRFLLYTLLISLSILSNSFGQCVPNVSIVTPGIFPDSATGLVSGVVGQPYSQVLQVRVPVDTIVPVFGRRPIINLQLLSLTSLPPGLVYSCTPSNCTFPGNSNGCVLISGTPTLAGLFNPKAFVKGTVDLGFAGTMSETDSLNYYTITINNTATGLAQHSSNSSFSLEQNSPNPYNDFTSINFTVPSNSDIDFRVYNMIGKEVYHKQQHADAGLNLIRLDGRDFAPGVYMYTVTFGVETLTKRMVISRK